MTKESTLHRWALLDKMGETRGTCTAPGRWRARLEFKRMRNGRPLAEGWSIVDRGPVDESVQRSADAFHEAIEQAKPRAFQVGDRVKVTSTGQGGSDYPFFKPGDTGTIQTINGNSFRVEFDTPREGEKVWSVQGHLGQSITLLEPAPQPKAEETLGALRIQFQNAMNMPGAAWPDLVKSAKDYGMGARITACAHCGERFHWGELGHRAAAEEAATAHIQKCSKNPMIQETATLKAEVERLHHSLADARSEMTENYHQFSQARDRAEAAEAKLADIAAIMRVNDMVSAIPEDAEPWHFHGLVQTVLDR